MSEHVLNELSAYQDGELEDKLREQVERHLKTCSLCQAELAQLQQLTSLLRLAPAPRARLAPRAFAARLTPLLPKRGQPAPEERSLGSWGWLVLPAGLVLTGAVLWASSWITTLLFLANQGGLLGGLSRYLPGVGSQSGSLPGWYTLLQGILSENLATALLNIQGAWNSIETIFFSLGGALLLALIYLAWLAVLWNRRPLLQNQQAKA